MENYKIINKNTNKVTYLNSLEKDNFFKLNNENNYITYNLTEKKKLRKNKILDALAMLTVVAATYIAIVIYINTYC